VKCPAVKYAALALLLAVSAQASKTEDDLRAKLAASDTAHVAALKVLQAKLDKVTAEGAARTAAIEKSSKSAATGRTKASDAATANAATAADTAQTNAATTAAASADISADVHSLASKAAIEAANAKKAASDLNRPLWFTLLVASLSTLGTLLGWLKVRTIHKAQEATQAMVLKIELSINSRMDKLLQVTETAALAKGALDEAAKNAGGDTKLILEAIQTGAASSSNAKLILDAIQTGAAISSEAIEKSNHLTEKIVDLREELVKAVALTHAAIETKQQKEQS